MATPPLSVSASALRAIPSSSFPKLCRPYALLVSARRRPPLQLICKRSSLVRQYSFGLRRSCHLTGSDPNSERFHGFPIEALQPSGGSGTAGEPPSGQSGKEAEPPTGVSGKAAEPPSGPSGKVAEPPSGPSGKTAEPPSGPSGKADEPPTGVSGKGAEPPSGPSGKVAEPPSGTSGKAAEPPSGPSGKTAEPPSGPSGKTAEPPSGPSGNAAEPPTGVSGKAAEPPSGPNGKAAEPPSGPSGKVAEPPSGPSGKAAEPPSGPSGKAAEPPSGPSGKAAEPPSGPSGKTAEPPRGPSGKAAEPPIGVSGKAAEPPSSPSGKAAEPPTGVRGKAAEPPSGPSGKAAEPPATDDLKKKKKKEEEFQTEEQLAESLAKYVADLSEKCIKEKGFFNVAFSGGPLIHSLRKLLDKPYVQKVEWSKWRVFWVDEIVVPRDHNDSNYKVAYDKFLSRVPILLRNVYAINDAVLDDAAADDYEDRLKRLVNCRAIEISTETEFPKFDLVLLGMGSDGHVGSLFPGHAVLNENERWVAYMDDSPKGPRKRITMTLPVINASNNVALVVCGGAQADAVAKGWAQPTTDITAALPAQKISPEKEFFWFLDKDAASKLPKTQN